VFTPSELELRRAELAAYMESAQPWLDPELNLTSLAEQLGLNTVQLSFLINNAFGQNFNDFVNAFRVEAVKEKLATPELQHYSLLAIAFESGFNSKATFNRAFKKRTGDAPSRYQR
jgi:AraC-like DNA-binding protein